MGTLIIGDIHGCWEELQALLDKAGPGKGDLILTVGDMVDRGPDSPRVLDFFLNRKNAASLRGNHEERHVRAGQGKSSLGFSHEVARLQWPEKDYRRARKAMARLPLWRELPEVVVTHGYWEPGRRARRQREAVLLGLAEGLNRLWKRHQGPWYEFYDGDKPLVVGHLDYLQNGEPFVYQDRVFALDTGCCRGQALTGLLLPSFKLLQVKARGKHWQVMKEEYRRFRRYDLDAHADLGWQELERLLREIDGLADLPAGLRDRRRRLRRFQRRAEAAQDALLAEVHRRETRIQTELRAQPGFEALPAGKRRRRFRRAAGDGALGRLLVLADKGRLGRRALRKHFDHPKALIRFCDKLGLVPTASE